MIVISLNANNASLKDVIEDIGRRMDIDVEVVSTVDEKITEKFDGLSLETALERLSANYAYILDSEKEDGKIRKIVLLSRGKEGRVMSKSALSNRRQDKKAGQVR